MMVEVDDEVIALETSGEAGNGGSNAVVRE